MARAVLELEKVTVQFDDDVILRDITMSVFEGETAVLIGPSGGGKSVLLKTMAGIQPPSRGHVLCYGQDWQSLSIAGKHDLCHKVGMQFQKSALFDALTVFENVAFPLREHESPSEDEVRERVTKALAAVGLEKAAGMAPHELSGGMKLRLGVARAIVLNPELLFLDDPTAGLDPLNSDAMADLILKLKSEIGATLVIATHDILRAYQLAGRIFLVADKTVIETGSAEETRRHPDARVQQFINGRLEGPLKPS